MSDYVDADVNEVDAANAASPTAERVLEFVARQMADEPEAVSVSTESTPRGLKLNLRVGAGDVGRVIGRRGRTAQALRTLIAAAGARDGVATNVDILD